MRNVHVQVVQHLKPGGIETMALDLMRCASADQEVHVVSLEGVAVVLEGTAYDPEDGTLDGASLTWTSSVDGLLGTGRTMVTDLSPGVHSIALAAEDSDANTISRNLRV